MAPKKQEKDASPQRNTRSAAAKTAAATPVKAPKGGDPPRGRTVREAEPALDSSPFLGNDPPPSILPVPLLTPGARVDGIQNPRHSRPPPPEASEVSDDGIEPLGDGLTGQSPTTRSGKTRSSSPSKKWGKFQLAKRPIDIARLDSRTAREAGGFLDKYRDLVTVGYGEGVIPASLKVRPYPLARVGWQS